MKAIFDRIETKLFLVILAAIVASILVGSRFGFQAASDAVAQVARNDSLKTLSIESRALESSLQNLISDVSYFSGSFEVIEAFTQENQKDQFSTHNHAEKSIPRLQSIQRFLKTHAYHEGIRLIHAESLKEIAHIDNLHPQNNHAASGQHRRQINQDFQLIEALRKRPRAEMILISQISHNQHENQKNHPLLNLITPVYNKNSQIIGYVVSEIALNRLLLGTMQEDIIQEHHFYIVTQTGVNIYDHDLNASGTHDGELPSPHELTQTLGSNSTGIVDTDSHSFAHARIRPFRDQPGEYWVIFMTTSEQSAINLAHRAHSHTYIPLIFFALFTVGLATYATRYFLIGPLEKTTGIFNRLAEGDLTTRLILNSHDAFGRMAHSLNTSVGSIQKSIQTISSGAHSLSAAAEQLIDNSDQMASTVEKSANNAREASDAADLIDGNLHAVASNVDQLSSSIREIARNAAESALTSRNAVSNVQSMNDIVSRLDASSIEIGNVLKVIDTIAEQTNLLALNATIEAARAGEAGKGFAVVANEVKELAKETSKATDEISSKIEINQNDTRDAIDAIRDVTSVISHINDIANTIASSVEEQSATTREIANSTQDAAERSGTITKGLETVAESTVEASDGVSYSRKSAQELGQLAFELRELVTHFRC